MGKFGPLKYAVLCKARELRDQDGESAAHKGTGFVQFRDARAAE
jgi:hypothetical protein